MLYGAVFVTAIFAFMDFFLKEGVLHYKDFLLDLSRIYCPVYGLYWNDIRNGLSPFLA